MLLDFPDDLLSNSILKYLTVADLLHLRAACHTFYGLEGNAIEREFKERDDALILSRQYDPAMPIMSSFYHRQRVVAFERCSSFAWDMTRHAQLHERPNFSCHESNCKYIDDDTKIPDLAMNGLGKVHLFFAQFTYNTTLLWQGFLQNYELDSDYATPLDDLMGNPDDETWGDAVTDTLGSDVGSAWIEFQPCIHNTDDKFHCDASNVSNLTRNNVTCDLHVTLLDMIYSQDQSENGPELKLLYSSRRLEPLFINLDPPLRWDLPSVDVLRYPEYSRRHRETWDFDLPIFIWKSGACLHSLSLLHKPSRRNPDDISSFLFF